MSKRITSVPDTPLWLEKDEFDTQRYVDGLVEFIRYAATPLTIALQGEWGSGKTSLMNRLFNSLCSDKGEFRGIIINTWEYSMLASPEETVYRIIEALVGELGGPDQKKFLMQFLRKSSAALLNAAGEFLKGNPGAAIGAGVQGLTAEHADEKEASVTELRAILKSAIDKEKKRILVFVDDLDRLNPPVAVEILELLKNIFSLDGCIFILAIDYEVVVKGLEPKFGKLNDNNEREFRSFFDKIIQVPFSLPVNCYKPNKYLIDKLQEIGYVSANDRLNFNDHLSKKFSDIVEKTVGRNPRSIKRLINSISLINCIGHTSGTQAGDTSAIKPDSVAGKIINFAVIAIQISYPRIYKLLIDSPNNKTWDWDVARKFNAPTSEEAASWESVLSAICDTDAYLQTRKIEIQGVIELIYREISDNAPDKNPGDVLGEFLNRSSMTGVGMGVKTSSDTFVQILKRLHPSVVSAMRQKHNAWAFSSRKNTGCGGFSMQQKHTKLLSKLSPHNSGNDHVTMRLEVPTLIGHVEYPGINCLQKSPDTMGLDNPNFKRIIDEFDAAVSPLFNSWFKGLTLTQRLQQWSASGSWQNPKAVLLNTTFDFELPTASSYELPDVIDTMVAVHEAVWNLHESMKKHFG